MIKIATNKNRDSFFKTDSIAGLAISKVLDMKRNDKSTIQEVEDLTLSIFSVDVMDVTVMDAVDKLIFGIFYERG